MNKLILSLFLFISACQAIPWVAEPRPDAWWVERHESFIQNTIANGQNTHVLFYGDSITEGWGGAGAQIWAAKYAPLGATNYGIGGDRTEHLLYRIADGETDNLSPKLIVLKIGTNNGGDSVDDVVRGIEAVVQLLRERMPDAKILLLGVLPRNDANWFARVQEINTKIAPLDNGSNIRFLDMFNDFAESWGVVRPDLYTDDKLHLVTAGYQQWADSMENLFNEMFNSK